MEQTNKANIFLGLNDKETKRQKISTRRAARILAGLLCERFDGATVQFCKGIYKHENGRQVRENSFNIILYYVDLETVRAFASELCRVFNQETVLIDFGPASVEFYAG